MAEITPPESAESPQKPAQPKELKSILPELRERFPKAFASDPEAIMPLALGIHRELMSLGYHRKALYKALMIHTDSPTYLAALAAGKPRVNLDGEPVSPVSDEHRQEAAAALADPTARQPQPQPDKPPPVALTGRIEKPPKPKQKKTPMPSSIELKGLQAKIAVTIDAATFRAALGVDTMGVKAVPATLAVEGKTYTADLNPKSFRKAQTAFQEAAQPVVSIAGNLKGDVIEAAGIQVFDKGGKPAQAQARASTPVVVTVKASAPPPLPLPLPEPGATAPAGGTARPKLSLKPKAGS
jgi:sRNA-binding protein